jgi:hypothetical protein
MELVGGTEISLKSFKDILKELKPMMTLHLYPERISIENSTMEFDYSGSIEV